jgi:hypothetical protein
VPLSGSTELAKVLALIRHHGGQKTGRYKYGYCANYLSRCDYNAVLMGRNPVIMRREPSMSTSSVPRPGAFGIRFESVVLARFTRDTS